jgi:hypothetical protein
LVFQQNPEEWQARRARGARRSIDINEFDAVIIAASVHQRDHQEAIEASASACRAALNAKPTTFLSVSLSAIFDEERGEAQDYVARFVERTGWRPGVRNRSSNMSSSRIGRLITSNGTTSLRTGKRFPMLLKLYWQRDYWSFEPQGRIHIPPRMIHGCAHACR